VVDLEGHTQEPVLYSLYNGKPSNALAGVSHSIVQDERQQLVITR
jgi:hypothetical protein